MPIIRKHKPRQHIIFYDEKIPYIRNVSGHYLSHKEWEQVKEDIDEFYETYTKDAIIVANKEFEEYKDSLIPEGFTKVSSKKNNPSYLYVIKAGKYYKIGYTSKLESRMKSIQTGNYNKIELIKKFFLYNYSEVERVLHEEFDEGRKVGEWFDLSEDDLNYIDAYIDEYGDICE